MVKEGFGSISYLRVAVTDRCNFRCIYCMPAFGWQSGADILGDEEIVRLVRIAVELGVRKVRLTGGEPLMREGIVGLVEALASLPGLEELTLTTNGSLLSRYAAELAKAGLRRVNVSLDSLRPDRFRRITRVGRLEDVLAGIAAAKEAGLFPIKLNVVVLRGINDNEVVDLAKKSEEGFQVRFVEYMPIGGPGEDLRGRFVPGPEIKARVEEALGPLVPLRREGPAQVFHIPGASGEIGFITALSAPFCPFCNRLRLTADGKLRLCLLSPLEIDLKEPLRACATDEELQKLMLLAAEQKSLTHRVQGVVPGRVMAEIGG